MTLKIKAGSAKSRTMGRCHGCGRAFVWKYTTKMKIREGVPCPCCGVRLRQTAHYARSCSWVSLDGTPHPELTVPLVRLAKRQLDALPAVIRNRRAKAMGD